MSGNRERRGWVVRARAGFYQVVSEGETFECRLRGRFKRGPRELAQPVAVGDQVRFTPTRNQSGVIEEVLPRESWLARTRGNKPDQVIVANLEQVIVVFAVREPVLERLVLDRFLAAAEALDLAVHLCINKCDLLPLQRIWRSLATYRQVGYPLLLTSATTGLGLGRLRRVLQDRISAITGPSGVGKSSLLNALQPGMRLPTGPLTALGEGRHITSEVRLFPLDFGGFVADTPGIRSMALIEVEPETLPACFPEILQHGADCRFQNCSHLREPDCAVAAALADGRIDPLRYQSYCQIRRELEEQRGF